MGLLDGKKILVTGVLTDSSIAFHIARLAQEQGAQVVLSSYGRVLSLTTRIAGRLPQPAPIIELDVTNEADLAALESRVRAHFPNGLDGVVHSIGFAPEAALGGNFLNTSWEDVSTAMHVSAYSLKSLTMAARPLFNGGGRVFGPQPRDYSFKLNKKLKSLARKSALTYKAKDNNIVVLEAFSFDSIKTANYVKIMADLKLTDAKTLLVLPAANNNVYLSSRNLKKAKVVTAAELNTYDVLNSGTLLLTTETVKTLEEAFAK